MDIIVFFSYSHIKADMQIIINIIITFTFYLLIGYSFWLIYSVVKFFNLTHAAYITISAYLTYSLVNQTRLHILMDWNRDLAGTVPVRPHQEKKRSSNVPHDYFIGYIYRPAKLHFPHLGRLVIKYPLLVHPSGI